MRLLPAISALAGVAALALAGVLADSPKQAAAPPPAERGVAVAQASRSESAARLQVAQVVLFNSGVGYFQREGEVDGDTRIDLSFPAQDVNDLLKSLVVQDLGGGQVSAMALDSPAPVERTLHSFAIDLSGNPSLGQILDQARGEKVEVVLQQTATTQPGTLSGSIIGIEKQKRAAGKDGAVEVEQLNLWCAEGMRAVTLTDVQRLRFLNPVLESEFRKALEVVTLSHDTQKKAVGLTLSGQGKRQVRVGYVVENPIWKTSYRLVLEAQKKRPFLQGWAVVENATDEDWNGVRMALVSGRPISFRMDLYQPLFVPRPTVEPELFASLRPPTYNSAVLVDGGAGIGGGMRGLAPPSGPVAADPAMQALRRGGAIAAGDALGRNGKATKLAIQLDDRLDLAKGIAEAATASNLGDYFEYAIDHPVSLARQKSAMLPLVNREVGASRVSIYNERVHAKFPLLGLRLKNDIGLHLTQGPITVFEGSNYAGDTRILDLQPGEERLVSYAIDLGTEVQAVPAQDNGQLTAVKLQKGILTTTTKQHESKTYTLTNRSGQERTVLIEHPFRPDFTLTSADKPVETARDVYRFEVKLPKGEMAKRTVAEDRLLKEEVVLTNLDDNRIRVLISDTASSPKVKEALRTALEKRGKLARTQQEIANQQRELNAIKTEQPRLRANLEKIPLTDPLAKRILEKLNQQETEIETYEPQIKQLNARADQERKDYENYLANLNVE
jgi:hypothetical protein